MDAQQLAQVRGNAAFRCLQRPTRSAAITVQHVERNLRIKNACGQLLEG